MCDPAIHSSDCKICFDRERAIVFYPCNHLVCCGPCAHAVDKCPVCRVWIQRRDVLLKDVNDDDADQTFAFGRAVVQDESITHRTVQRSVHVDSLGSGLLLFGNEHAPSVHSVHDLETLDRVGSFNSFNWRRRLRSLDMKVMVRRMDPDKWGYKVASYFETLVAEVQQCNAEVHCNNIVRNIGISTPQPSLDIWLLQEFMDAGSLNDLSGHLLRVGGMPIGPIASVAWQVLHALEFVHGRSLAFGEMTPSKVLLQRCGRVKLSYTPPIARELKNRKMMEGRWTVYDLVEIYMPPERARGEDWLPVEADVWSLGMILMKLTSGKHPFHACTTFPALYEALCEQSLPMLDWEAQGLPSALADFCGSCLACCAADRPAASDLVEHDLFAAAVFEDNDIAMWLNMVLQQDTAA